ncbi:MAG: tetratricopeptide repeat protein [Bacteroidota bacterium]|jgi:Flp pilus assembly protein TadD|nr:tetratricopeptide repeat protein [Bacteroidota bacterium]
MDSRQQHAIAAYEQQDYERAITLLFEAASATDEVEVRARLLVKCALSQDALGRHTDALETLQQVLDVDPDSTAGWNTLGIVCQHIGKLDEARAAFERAYRLNPEHADPLVNLGAVCLRQGDPGNALQYLQLAVEMLPGHPAVHANLALTYAVFGRLEEAEEALRLAVLYGFDQAEAIEERLAGLKAVRERILSGARRDDETGQIPPDSGVADRG